MQATDPWKRRPWLHHQDHNVPCRPHRTPSALISGRATCVAVVTGTHLTASIPLMLAWPPVLSVFVYPSSRDSQGRLFLSYCLLSKAVPEGSVSSLASSPEEPVTSAVQSPVSVARTSFPGMAAPSEGRLRLPPHPTSQTLLSKVSADLSQFSAAHMYLMAHSWGGVVGGADLMAPTWSLPAYLSPGSST